MAMARHGRGARRRRDGERAGVSGGGCGCRGGGAGLGNGNRDRHRRRQLDKVKSDGRLRCWNRRLRCWNRRVWDDSELMESTRLRIRAYCSRTHASTATDGRRRLVGRQPARGDRRRRTWLTQECDRRQVSGHLFLLARHPAILRFAGGVEQMLILCICRSDTNRLDHLRAGMNRRAIDMITRLLVGRT